MVVYCCVKGCGNNSRNKKKDPNDMTSFHSFPSNIEIRQNWLRAIGRPDWSPSGYSCVCSNHFSVDQINNDGRRIRLKDGAVPVKDLPTTSKFEASEVEVCRFCLAAEVKLYSLQDGVHRVYLESIVSYKKNYNMEGLPQFICYECAAHLKKCYDLIEKSLTVQATLLDIFAQHGKITTNLIKAKNRKELNLSSPLSLQEIIVEDNLNTANSTYSIPKVVKTFEIKTDNIQNTEKRDVMNFNVIEDKEFMNGEIDWLDDEFLNSADTGSEDEIIPEIEDKGVQECEQKEVKKLVKLNLEGLRPFEVDLQKTFNVVRLTFDQQIEEWTKAKDKKQITGESFICEICSKVYAHKSRFRRHIRGHDPITTNLIKAKNRKELNLSSPLSLQEIIVEDNLNTANSTYSIPKVVNNFEIKTDNIQNTEKRDVMNFNVIEDKEFMNGEIDWLDDEFLNSADRGSEDDIIPEIEDKGVQECEQKEVKKLVKLNLEGLRPFEVDLQKTFNVVRLTFDQQIEEWTKAKDKKQITGESFICEICSKVYAHKSRFRRHIRSHDPALGGAECYVCRRRFPSGARARSHQRRAHATQYCCRLCPNTYSNVGMAKKHQEWHSGRVYRCGRCARGYAHAGSLGAHARAAHPAAACPRCARAFVNSRGLRLHQQAMHPDLPVQRSEKTTKRTRNQSRPNLCNKCDVEFASRAQLLQHNRAEHPAARRTLRLPDDHFPTKCEHCDVVVENRRQHWSHVRRAHPALRGSYRAIIAVVCDVCGKGFQNLGKLRVHSLRHGAPRLACGVGGCPRLFHDKYALARHAATHAPARPYVCARCGLAFNQRSNMLRHARVHSGLAAYECPLCGNKFKYSSSRNLHVRTVHQRQPLPPRRRKPNNKPLDETPATKLLDESDTNSAN